MAAAIKKRKAAASINRPGNSVFVVSFIGVMQDYRANSA